MKNIFKQTMLIISSMAMISFLLSSCGNKSNNDYEYLPVKMASDEGWSIIDKDGNVVVNDEYPSTDMISPIYDGAYWVYNGTTFQLFSINNPKKPVIDEEFTCATAFHAGLSAVSSKNRPIRLIDTKGNTVTTLGKNIKRCYEFSEDGYAVYMDSNDKYGIIDKNGKEVVKATYAYMVNFICDGVVLASKHSDDKYAIVVNTKGEELGKINTEKYNFTTFYYSEGKIVLSNKDDEKPRQVVLDKEGKCLFTIRKSSGSNDDARYMDGYVSFKNADNKYGIIDDEGNEVIRAKYDGIINLGNGEFAVRKDGNKWGVVNYKDEEILDFDYSYALSILLDGNYVMKDGNEYLIIKKGSKNEVLASFDETILYSPTSLFAYYVDAENVVNKIVKTIEEYEHPRTASELASDFSLDASSYSWRSYIDHDVSIDRGISLDIKIYFSNMTEYVSRGYFSGDWKWTNELPSSIECSLTTNSDDIDIKAIYKNLADRLAHGRQKADNKTYYKSVKNKNGETKVYTYLLNDDNNVVSFIMNYEKVSTDKQRDVVAKNGEENDMQILFDRKLTESDLSGVSKRDLEIMRNMIYARHGYKFKRNDLQKHFSQYSWYSPTNNDVNAIYKELSDIEKYNVEFIKKHE